MGADRRVVTSVGLGAAALALVLLGLFYSRPDGTPESGTVAMQPSLPPPGNADAAVVFEDAFPSLPGLERPVVMLQMPGEAWMLVALQEGRILSFPKDAKANSVVTVLDWRGKTSRQGNEEGLLGLTLDPAFAQNGFLYAYYSAKGGQRRTVLSRFKTGGSGPALKVDAASELVILQVPQPFPNHKGGSLVFGPDGMLYLGLGDGGDAGDPNGNGQDLKKNLLGSIIRIDVRGATKDRPYAIPPDNPFAGATDGTRKETWAYGLRNPWRFSFDPQSGLLIAADVGQDQLEEIDFIEKGGNYGWNVMEGTQCYRPKKDCRTDGLVLPVAEYRHDSGACSVTGGYVYRGRTVTAMQGAYFFGDFCNGAVWEIPAIGSNSVRPQAVQLLATGPEIASSAVDQDGRAVHPLIRRSDLQADRAIDAAGKPRSRRTACRTAAQFAVWSEDQASAGSKADRRVLASRGAKRGNGALTRGEHVRDTRMMAALKKAGPVAGRYRIERFLGRGGTSEVWLAQDEHLDRKVAIKFLQPSLTGTGEFERETGILSSLRHPNIVTVYDAGEADGRRFIVMEHVEGRALRERLQQGPIGSREASRVGAAIAAALADAHAHGVLHNDVKPENILFDRNGEPRLTDFGTARITGETLDPTQSLEIMGTLPYMAPELLQGLAPQPGADVYSLAVVLYESVAGRLPFDGRSNAAIVGEKLKGTLPRQLDTALHVLGALSDAISSGMAFTPADRPDAAAFAGLLAGVAAIPEPQAPVPLSPLISYPPSMETEPIGPMPFTGPGRPARRRWPLLGLATLAGIGLLLAGAIAVAWGGNGPPAEARSAVTVSPTAGPPTVTAVATPAVQFQAAPVKQDDHGKNDGKGRGNNHGRGGDR